MDFAKYSYEQNPVQKIFLHDSCMNENRGIFDGSAILVMSVKPEKINVVFGIKMQVQPEEFWIEYKTKGIMCNSMKHIGSFIPKHSFSICYMHNIRFVAKE